MQHKTLLFCPGLIKQSNFFTKLMGSDAGLHLVSKLQTPFRAIDYAVKRNIPFNARTAREALLSAGLANLGTEVYSNRTGRDVSFADRMKILLPFMAGPTLARFMLNARTGASKFNDIVNKLSPSGIYPISQKQFYNTMDLHSILTNSKTSAAEKLLIMLPRLSDIIDVSKAKNFVYPAFLSNDLQNLGKVRNPMKSLVKDFGVDTFDVGDVINTGIKNVHGEMHAPIADRLLNPRSPLNLALRAGGIKKVIGTAKGPNQPLGGVPFENVL